VCRKRTPVSCAIALEIAGATSGGDIWPAPVGWLSVDIKGFAAANGHAGKSDDDIRAAMGDKFWSSGRSTG
jgi:hypothetical protein